MTIPPEAVTAAIQADGNWAQRTLMSPSEIGYWQTRVIASLEAAAPAIRAAERERIYAELGNDHYVIFTEDGWTVEHSVECRFSGHMHECDWLKAVRRIADEGPGMLGRWLIEGIDSEGLPALVRAGPDGATP